MDENKITIAVCGDSYCAGSVDDYKKTVGYRTHFSQLLADRYNYNVIPLAHGGFSNVGIIYQIKYAVSLKPDVILYNKTWSDRVTVVQNEGWDENNTLKNFFYYDQHYESSNTEHVGNKKSAVISTVWQNLENSPFIDYSEEQLTAIKLYLKHLFNYSMQQDLDGWLFELWHNKIVEAGIMPINFNKTVGAIAYDWSFKNQSYESPFHTDVATQEIIAEHINKLIRNK